MSPRPTIFISAVSKELKSSRQLVSNTLQFLGYEPVWQDIFGTGQGDLRAMLRQKVDGCKGVVQLVGKCYGAEPPAPDEQFGRVSYTQYEALYAKQRGKKVWYLFLDDDFPGDAHEAESEELRELQATYRRRLKSESQLYYPLNSREALETSVLKLRDDLTRLRRGVKQWAAAVIVLLLVLVGAVTWLKSGQRQEGQQLVVQNQQIAAQNEQLKQQNQQLAAMAKEMAMLVQGVEQYPEVENKIRQETPNQDAAEVQHRTYDELGKQLKTDPKQLEEKLPKFAQKLASSTNATALERANAAYVTTNYVQAERLALIAADEAQKATPPKTADAIKALDLAANSANAQIKYAAALEHYRAAARLTDRTRDPCEWALQQYNIASVLNKQGQYAEAEPIYRNALDEYRRDCSDEDMDAMGMRSSLASTLASEGKYAESETEYRDLVKLQEKVLGPDNDFTLFDRDALATVLKFQKKYADAETEFRDIVAILTKKYGPEYFFTLDVRAELADTLLVENKYAEGESEYRDVVSFEGKVFGPESKATIKSSFGLATALAGENKVTEADAEFRNVIQLQEKVFGPDQRATLYSRYMLAAVLVGENKDAAAEAEFRDVITLQQKALGSDDDDTLSSREGLASVLMGAERWSDAEQELREIISIRTKLQGSANNKSLMQDRNNLVSVLMDQRKFADAETEGRAVVAQEETALGAENPVMLRGYSDLATALLGQGKYEEAEPRLRKVVESEEQILGLTNAETSLSILALARCLQNESKTNEAKDFARQGMAVAKAALGENSPMIQQFQTIFPQEWFVTNSPVTP